MRILAIFGLGLGLLAGGCMTSGSAPTASGSPEVTMRAPPDRAKAALMNVVLNRGLRVKSDSAYSLIVEQETKSTAARVLTATDSSTPVERVSFNIAPVAGGTRIVADSSYVTKPGTAFEQQVPNSAWKVFGPAQLQSLLDEAAASAGRS